MLAARSVRCASARCVSSGAVVVVVAEGSTYRTVRQLATSIRSRATSGFWRVTSAGRSSAERHTSAGLAADPSRRPRACVRGARRVRHAALVRAGDEVVVEGEDDGAVAELELG
jgi:hypothetical protein